MIKVCCFGAMTVKWKRQRRDRGCDTHVVKKTKTRERRDSWKHSEEWCEEESEREERRENMFCYWLD